MVDTGKRVLCGLGPLCIGTCGGGESVANVQVVGCVAPQREHGEKCSSCAILQVKPHKLNVSISHNGITCHNKIP